MNEEIRNNYKDIDIWKNKLLDQGKRNNLINYKDNKSSTLEILSPSFDVLFNKITTSSSIQVFDDKDYEDDGIEEEVDETKISRDEYLAKFKNKVPQSQLLVFNGYKKTRSILKGLMKKALDSITERGVNILYVAIGFLKWREAETSNIFYKAPLLLVPITITNEAVNKPFHINRFDDDVSFNTSLQYLLKNQYGINVPNYEEQDIEEFLSLIENETKNLGWEIIREARISTFSFNKLNMYLDMDRNAKAIADNPNVAALTNAEVNVEEYTSDTDTSDIIKSHDLFIKQHNVVDADFSQTEAIEYALMGKSFVLQGPPGTGKSQTITNIIAELIYAGKKVLFVSEKMAALEVVFNNLKKANLEDFCLELHSYKANKKDVIDDLYKALKAEKRELSSRAINNGDRLKEMTDRLNDYESEIHKIYHPIDMSLYQLIVSFNHLSKYEDFEFVLDSISLLSKNDLDNNCKLLNHFANFEKSIGYNYKNNPLYGLSFYDSSFAFKQTVKSTIEKAYNLLIELLKDLNSIKNEYHISLGNNKEIEAFINFSRFCLDNKLTNNKIYDSNTLDDLVKLMGELKVLSSSINNTDKYILNKYDESLYKENIKELYTCLYINGSSFIKRLFNSKYKEAKLKLKSFKLDGKSDRYKVSKKDLSMLSKRFDNMETYNAKTEYVRSLEFVQFDELKTDWDNLISKLNELKKYYNECVFSSGDKISTINYVNSDNTLIDKVFYSYYDFDKAEKELIKYIDSGIIDTYNIDINRKSSIYKGYLDNLVSIDNWIEFLKLLDQLKESNLIKFVNYIIEKNKRLEDISNYYKMCFYRQWTDYIFENNAKLRDYTRFYHDMDIKDFSFYDKNQLDISRAEINAKLSEGRPDLSVQLSGSPAGTIMREHEKKRKIKPIRTLFAEIPGFIQQLKPCFLMSPLSVSTFLPDGMKFDVTIFDEASQVFPEDAIVAIYRSKQLIVVGDSKQMPPSNFFMALDNDGDEYNDELSDADSYESILDLCSTAFPTKSLLCHYRSKNESLINFSNKNFYNYDLITYPSVFEKKDDLGVDFFYLPNGVINSKSKVNVVEAEKVADLVFEHFRKYPDRSLGVVAFNIRQQDAILKIIDKRRSKDPSLEEFFKPELDEPFFVKNLETVQGDERDTIIFSITYAKNDKGQFAMRFGPLNNVGGERRLNVAITRAKLNVKVVSSIRAIDIDVSRVSNDGPKLLHDYLDYAEHGNPALDRAISVNDSLDFDSPFEQDVYEFLKENGFDVSTQVGCSKYRIDLGLKRPGTSDYVLAIECDGATYHSSRSARDRDRLRQSVLERMNWKFYRIWSTDWYKNSNVEKKELLKACKEALESDSESFEETNSQDEEDHISKTEWTKIVNNKIELFDTYQSYKGTTPYNANKAAEIIASVEGPISVDFLLRKICFLYGRQKVTADVKDRFIVHFVSDKCVIEGNFLYYGNQKDYAMRENIGNFVHDINYVSDYELRNGMYEIIKANIQCGKQELFNSIRDHLGFGRAGDKITNKLEKAFRLLRPYVLMDKDGNISINKDRQLIIIRRKK